MKTTLSDGLEEGRIQAGWNGTKPNSGPAGAFVYHFRQNLTAHIVADAGQATGWEHVSAHMEFYNRAGKLSKRSPSWGEMHKIKRLFWYDSEVVMQLHSKDCDWKHGAEYVVHLWRPINEIVPVPPKANQ